MLHTAINPQAAGLEAYAATRITPQWQSLPEARALLADCAATVPVRIPSTVWGVTARETVWSFDHDDARVARLHEIADEAFLICERECLSDGLAYGPGLSVDDAIDAALAGRAA